MLEFNLNINKDSPHTATLLGLTGGSLNYLKNVLTLITWKNYMFSKSLGGEEAGRNIREEAVQLEVRQCQTVRSSEARAKVCKRRKFADVGVSVSGIPLPSHGLSLG